MATENIEFNEAVNLASRICLGSSEVYSGDQKRFGHANYLKLIFK